MLTAMAGLCQARLTSPPASPDSPAGDPEVTDTGERSVVRRVHGVYGRARTTMINPDTTRSEPTQVHTFARSWRTRTLAVRMPR